MGGEGGSKGGTGLGACRFRARMEHYLYSGEKKHLFVSMIVFGAIFGTPRFLMNQGSKHQSHQNYMEKADKARSARLSSGQSSSKLIKLIVFCDAMMCECVEDMVKEKG